ncbi:MAG: aspartate kinase [Puniceicoccales bacterium]|jgi:aspartate kinase|nr:aspartate kinase [Puniceicoccales bacterium]
MALIVQKYGGTSVANVDRIKNVAARVKSFWQQGNKMVVVVSARSGVTNELVARAKALHAMPNEREMDMLLSVGEQETIALLSIALHAIGVPACSRTGAQAGVYTDSLHTRARISRITGGDINERLEEGKVVIVAGFQGISPKDEVTTLGRGGSDLTAIAIAAAVSADLCQIYTDVEGVFTADPRVVLDARKLQEIDYDEMLELASSGSKVMQARSVEFAKKYAVPFEVRSSLNDKPGTLVKDIASKTMEDAVVSGVAVDRTQTRVTVSDIPDNARAIACIFNALGDAGLNVDMIIKNLGTQGRANLTFSVNTDQFAFAERVIGAVVKELGSGAVRAAGEVAKLSVVGVGMVSHPGVAGTLFNALASVGVNCDLITTSEIKIAVAIDPLKADEAARAVHEAFELNKLKPLG